MTWPGMGGAQRPGTRASWIGWARRLQANAQNGLHFATTPFERVRWRDVQGIAAEMVAANTDVDALTVADRWEREWGYATPKVDVRGVVFDGDALLFVRELDNGRWSLPGGWADVTDAPAAAVVREISEETGYRTRAVKLLACLDREAHGPVDPYPHKVYKLFFRCEVESSGAADELETDEVGWFRRDALPELSLGRIMPSQLELVFAHLDDPVRPADFD